MSKILKVEPPKLGNHVRVHKFKFTNSGYCIELEGTSTFIALHSRQYQLESLRRANAQKHWHPSSIWSVQDSPFIYCSNGVHAMQQGSKASGFLERTNKVQHWSPSGWLYCVPQLYTFTIKGGSFLISQGHTWESCRCRAEKGAFEPTHQPNYLHLIPSVHSPLDRCL